MSFFFPNKLGYFKFVWSISKLHNCNFCNLFVNIFLRYHRLLHQTKLKKITSSTKVAIFVLFFVKFVQCTIQLNLVPKYTLTMNLQKGMVKDRELPVFKPLHIWISVHIHRLLCTFPQYSKLFPIAKRKSSENVHFELVRLVFVKH